jgi:hypothetical protein
MTVKRVVAALAVVMMTGALVLAQEAKPANEARDPAAASADKTEAAEKVAEMTWEEFLEEWMTAKPFDKHHVVKVDDRYAYPHVVAGILMEIVREDDQYVWLRGLPPEDPRSALYKIWSQQEAEEARAADWAELASKPGALNFLDFNAVPVPPAEMESLVFEAAGSGLPNIGLWQMGFAVADMNEDGHVDLVFPPRRKEHPPAPSIWLGDGKGEFSYWEESRWPEQMPWDYGGVTVADLNNDGHQDVVFAVHFKAQFALFGNGQGRFPSGGILPSPDPRFTSRAVTAADFDGDGKVDLGFIAEIDYDMTTNARSDSAPTVWVLFNRGENWEVSTEGLPTNMIGDVIRSDDIDGDGRPELILSSNTLGPRMLVYTWRGEEGWQAAENRGVLSSAFHYNVESGDGGVYSTFVQFGRPGGNTEYRNGLIHYRTSFDGEVSRPEPLGRKGGGLEVYVQTEDGLFYRERGSELDDISRVMDIRLVDLDGDGRDDIIASSVELEEKNGGVKVWLSRAAF